MKNKVKQAQVLTSDVLKHVLSPLEQHALRRYFKPFKYKISNVFVYMSASACKQLLAITQQKVNLLHNAVNKERLSKKIPFRLREVFDDPAEVLSLPAYVRNKVCRLECYTLFAIMQKGRNYFLTEQKFGKRSMKALDDLFAKHGCAHLFKS